MIIVIVILVCTASVMFLLLKWVQLTEHSISRESGVYKYQYNCVVHCNDTKMEFSIKYFCEKLPSIEW